MSPRLLASLGRLGAGADPVPGFQVLNRQPTTADLSSYVAATSQEQGSEPA